MMSYYNSKQAAQSFTDLQQTYCKCIAVHRTNPMNFHPPNGISQSSAHAMDAKKRPEPELQKVISIRNGENIRLRQISTLT